VREYGQIQCSFWQSSDAQAFSDAGKLLATYLMTGPHSNGLGCYRCPDGYIMDDLGWSSERVSETLLELSRNGFAYRFDKVVLMPNFLRWNRISNVNVAKARQAEFDALPKGDAKTLLARALLEFGNHLPKGFETVLQTIAQTVTQTSSKQNPTLPNPIPRAPEQEKAYLRTSVVGEGNP
jgi:hypothetical protein